MMLVRSHSNPAIGWVREDLDDSLETIREQLEAFASDNTNREPLSTVLAQLERLQLTFKVMEQVGAGLHQPVPQGLRLARGHGEFVAQFARERDPEQPPRHPHHRDRAAAHEREGGRVDFIYRRQNESARFVIVTFDYGVASGVRSTESEACRATFATSTPPRCSTSIASSRPSTATPR